jgi:hypothetical protein
VTQPRDPELEQAACEAEASRRRTERDAAASRVRSGLLLSLRRTLHELREENGFSRLLDEALKGPPLE